MNDISALQDALIADEINRISSLSREQLANELIEEKTRAIENADPEEVLRLCQSRNHDD